MAVRHLNCGRIVVCYALLLTFTAAEREYFLRSTPLTWDDARRHCQVCYKDLVTVTPDNLQIIIRRVGTDHWIGLRKYNQSDVSNVNNVTDNNYNVTDGNSINSATDGYSYSDYVTNSYSTIYSNSSSYNLTEKDSNDTKITTRPAKTPCTSWCRWANGDPLIFQNWAPGMPVFKSPLPKIDCCSCSCTCPAPTTSVLMRTTVGQHLTTSSTASTTMYSTTTRSSTNTGSVYDTTEQPTRNTAMENSTHTFNATNQVTLSITTENTTNAEATQLKGTLTNPMDASSLPSTTPQMTPRTEESTTASLLSSNSEFSSTVKDSTNMGSQSDTTEQPTLGTTGNNTAYTGNSHNSTYLESSTITGSSTNVGIPMLGNSTSTKSSSMISPLGTTEQPTLNTNQLNPTNVPFPNNSVELTPTFDPVGLLHTPQPSTRKSQTSFSTAAEQSTRSTTEQHTTKEPAGVRSQTQTPTAAKSLSDGGGFISSSPWTAAQLPIEAACERSPMTIPSLSEIDDSYIEDSCVVILSDGPWVERSCTDVLPFICYEDKFFGQVNVTNVTYANATLNWLPGPGDISHYYVTVNGERNVMDNLTDLTLDLYNLTAGTYHEVQVFAVKCERDLNPQNASFYTVPLEVQNVKVSDQTETSVVLSWDKPDGNVDFYLVKLGNLEKENTSRMIAFGGLTPGSCNIFTVQSGVKDKSRWSDETNVTGCTKPAKVSDLKSEAGDSWIYVTWKKPEGTFTGFRVTVLGKNIDSTEDTNQNETAQNVTSLLSSTTVNISVRALVKHSGLQGEETSITTQTTPGPVLDLSYNMIGNYFTAKWNYNGSDHFQYHVDIFLEAGSKIKEESTTKTLYSYKLNSSTEYIVSVYVIGAAGPGPETNISVSTLPSVPTNLRVIQDKAYIHLTWDAPDDITHGKYGIDITIGKKDNVIHAQSTSASYTHENVLSGTRYIFDVYTISGKNQSDPIQETIMTEPDIMEISLSMLCSSVTSLLCDSTASRKNISAQLRDHLKKTLGEELGLYWDLTQPIT